MKLQFFINIAHEIRSPLTLILGPLEKLQRMQCEPDVNKMLLTIKYNTGRILNLINQLLDVRKIDKGQMPILCEEVDIRSFVNELLLVFTEQARLKKISLETKFPENFQRCGLIRIILIRCWSTCFQMLLNIRLKMVSSA